VRLVAVLACRRIDCVRSSFGYLGDKFGVLVKEVSEAGGLDCSEGSPLEELAVTVSRHGVLSKLMFNWSFVAQQRVHIPG
jgi:hypothetical protein